VFGSGDNLLSISTPRYFTTLVTSSMFFRTLIAFGLSEELENNMASVLYVLIYIFHFSRRLMIRLVVFVSLFREELDE
jgi:hypothetical protein